MRLTNSQIILLVALECVSVCLVYRLWRRPKLATWRRLFWTIVLLVPIFGWLWYGFVAANPSAHSDDLPEAYDGDIHH